MLHYTRDIVQIEQQLHTLLGSPYPEHLAAKCDALKSKRMQMRLTQIQLAELTGVTQTRISRAETVSEKTTEASALYALASAFECGLEDIAELPLNAVATITAADYDRISSRILEVVRVNTLAKPGVKTDLRTFYYRTEVTCDIGEKHTTTEINNLQDFGNRPALIQGVAGQGKSILLRYLTAKTYEEKNSVPLFFELRQFKGSTLLSAVHERLLGLGFCFSRSQVETLLREGKVSLFLDAYDELEQKYRAAFSQELGELLEKNPELKIVLSSRPVSGMANQSYLDTYEIAPLGTGDLMHVVRCYASKEESQNISNQLQFVSVEITKLLSSPLMILLLVIHFRYTDSVPHSTIAFYKDLLDVLLRRHNISDEGLKRPIKSGLNTHQLRLFFQALCYLVQRDYSDADVHISDLEDTACKALELSNLHGSALYDLISITNLMIEEGGYCRYIHKSVKEYYAAAFIASASLGHADAFYSSVRKKWALWEGVLEFLSIIDRVRWLKLFCLPDLSSCKPFSTRSFLSKFRILEFTGKASGKPVALKFLDSEAFCLRKLTPHAKIRTAQNITQHLQPPLGTWVINQLRCQKMVQIDRRELCATGTESHWDLSKLGRLIIGGSSFFSDIKDQFKSQTAELQLYQLRKSEFEV